METQTRIGKGIYFAHHKIEDKHYFGGFFNLAKNNITQIIREFCLRLSLNFDDKHLLKIIDNYFSPERSYSDWERAIEVLKEYLPVIEYLDLPVTDKQFDSVPLNEKEKEKRKYFRNNFKSLIKTIEDLRNFYTHYYHAPVSISNDTFIFLDNTLLKVCQEVKRNKMKDDKTRQILKKGIDIELEQLKALKIEDLERKKTELELEELKKKPNERKKIRINVSDIESIINAVYNDSFSHLMYKDGESYLLKDRYQSKIQADAFAENNTPISSSGIMFLLSMFLSKKETEQLKSNVEGYKGKVLGEDFQPTRNHNSLKFMATQWVFSYLSFKGLKQRVKNTFDKETLLIQMIDELSKVPDEVYQTLSKNDKDEFLEDMNEFVQEREGNDPTMLQSTVIHPVIRKRYEDKFNYFAVRFLDEFANFPTLKFQVFTGLYNHDTRQKDIYGSTFTSDRMIKEHINVFGKLTELAKYKSDYFSKDSLETGWELFPNPSYSFVGNNIPVFIDLKKKGEKAKQVQIEISRLRKQTNPLKKRENRISKKEIIELIYNKNKNIEFGEPTALLSSNELPALLYEFLVNKKSGEEIEQILADKIVERYETLLGYQTGQRYPKSFMSKKLVKSKSGQENLDTDKLLRAIEKEIDISDKKLDLIYNNRNETKELDRNRKPLRKFIFYSKELGQEATWLANDLKRFMPESARKNWKGIHHSELQRFLAYYDRNRFEAKAILTQFWDLNSLPIWGDGINKAFDCKYFDSFYQAYLYNRKETLKSFVNALKTIESEPKLLKKVLKEIFIVFDKRLYVLASTEKQKVELLSKPIVFPRGIFDNKPTFIRGEKVDTAPEKFADWYRYCYESSSKFQSFYALKGDYAEIFEKYKTEDDEFRINRNKLSVSEAFELFKKKQDYRIKKIKHHDLFVKLMADYLFEKTFNQKIDVELSKLYQTKAERLENQRIANEQNKREKGDYSVNKYNENFIWNKTIPMTLLDGRVFEPNVKLKDVGKFRKLESDEKVVQLLTYDPSRKWNKLELENEIENLAGSYERIRREQLLKAVHDFEKYILKRANFDGKNHPKDFELKGNPNFRKYIVNGILKKRNLSEEETSWLLQADFEKLEALELKTKSNDLQKTYFLILLRNKFGHNQLPNKEAYNLMLNYYPKATNETYSEYFNKVVTCAINEFN